MKITIFGDSITNGYNTGHPRILADKVEAACPEVTVALHGVNGEDSYDGLRRLPAVAAARADRNYIFFGANDAALSHEINASEFRANLEQMGAALGAERSVFITPPYFNDAVRSDFRSNSQILRFRESTLAAARQLSSGLIDLYAAMAADRPETWLQADGLHFSENGYDLLAALIATDLQDSRPRS